MSLQDGKDLLLTRKEAARYINFSPATLAAWASTRRHKIKFIKIGNSVRYRLSDLDNFLDEQMKI